MYFQKCLGHDASKEQGEGQTVGGVAPDVIGCLHRESSKKAGHQWTSCSSSAHRHIPLASCVSIKGMPKACLSLGHKSHPQCLKWHRNTMRLPSRNGDVNMEVLHSFCSPKPPACLSCSEQEEC